ncbi:unnamed protein product [Clonostachys rosea]|uniref:Uncharacterized protein n=1 Tax=Bionectria ochroleuca TaxID=29856 RepID=A0ABY6TMK0_BIOOC|nr:unnamed protein product [Clonostachys rosea]
MAAFSDEITSFCTKFREISVQTGVTWQRFGEKKYFSIWESAIWKGWNGDSTRSSVLSTPYLTIKSTGFSGCFLVQYSHTLKGVVAWGGW